MHYDHPAFVKPNDTSLKLWRYLEFTKLMYLLESSKLFFNRADLYRNEDPFEGTFPKLEYEYFVKRNGEDVIRNLFEITSRDTFLSCWHLNNTESIAMWKLYSHMDKGVVILTEVERFKDSFSVSDKKIFSGVIQYINYETEYFYSPSKHDYTSANGFTAFIHKREIYKYENEYRAVCTDPNGKDKFGLNIAVDVNKLIEKIIVAPNSPDWLFELVKNVTHKYYNNIEICRSCFDLKPYY